MTAKDQSDDRIVKGNHSQRIVSSAHLAVGEGAELSEFEFGLIVSWHAFSRWMERCMGAAGIQEVGALDVLVLHSVNHRGRDKKLSDICLVLNIEDTHLVTYSLKKLVKLGLVKGSRKGKESIYAVTANGRAACGRYQEVRVNCLMDTLETLSLDTSEIVHVARMLRALSGLYDQAARSAAVL
ncbi:MAG: winged helix DNA-binding protein [Rhodospirillales bacterium]|nr:winged helix DNA-binding protein [Rhodospirillales bacterium]